MGADTTKTQGLTQAPFWLRGAWPAALTIAGCAALWTLAEGSPFARFDREWADAMLRLRSQTGMAPPPDGSIFLIGLEKNDIEGLSTVAAEYRNYAEIIEMTSDLGAAVTAFDLILTRGGREEAEPVLAAARRSRAVVFAEANTGEREMLRSFPFAPVQVAAGLININPDEDGIHRGYEYAVASGGQCRPSLALAVYVAWRDSMKELRCFGDGTVRWPELGTDMKTLTEKRVPASVAALNYRSGFAAPWNRGFKYLNLRDLRRRYNAWKLSNTGVPADLPGPGSLVLVGSAAPGSGDSGPTPFGPNEPKVEIHAVALDDLIQGKMISSVGRLGAALGIVLLIAVFTAAARFATNGTALLLLWIGLVAVSFSISVLGLLATNILVPSVSAAMLMTLSFLVETGRRSGLVSLEKARMRTTMAMYFSPRVLDEVLRNPGATEPREADLTVLLTDLRNFTTITERFGSAVIFGVMNRVFEIETRAVIELDGSMEHFLGDQFLAYWGAPQEQPDASDRAMRAGKRIIEELDDLKRSLPTDLAALFGFGLAIHRGKALVGNKGSRERFDYGILGDIVNTAARVESLTKLYGVRWLITRDVAGQELAPEKYRALDNVRVKGRSGAVELIEVRTEPLPNWIPVRRGYRDALSAYTAGRFREALEAFEAIEREYADKASHVMAERCRNFLKSPPANWDGIYTLDEK